MLLDDIVRDKQPFKAYIHDIEREVGINRDVISEIGSQVISPDQTFSAMPPKNLNNSLLFNEQDLSILGN